MTATVPIRRRSPAGRGASVWRREITPFIARTSSTGTWSRTPNTSQLFGGYLINNTAAQNDAITFDVDLSAGTWKFEVLGAGVADGATASVQIDGTEVGTVDFYTASTTFNKVQSITGVVVASSGKKTLRLLLDDKNASSSGYRLPVTQIVAQRTA